LFILNLPESPRPRPPIPPTPLVGFKELGSAPRPCRLGMNDPPTALVGFGRQIVQTPDNT